MTIKNDDEATVDHLATVIAEDSMVRKLMEDGFSEEEALIEYRSNPSYKASMYPMARLHVENMYAKVEALRISVQGK
jgi:hypothetical protein